MSPKPIRTQALLNFALETLGWHSFQDLCITVAKHVFGHVPVTFLPSKDRGRDGAFYGGFSGPGSMRLEGVTTVQCKHTSRANARLSPGDVRDELTKAKRLVLKGLADNYVLMTNYGVSGTVEETLRKNFLAVGVKSFLVLDNGWINRELRESSKLRMLVPRVYGLGDLSQIIDERLYEQAQEILSTMEDDLSKIVITDAYRQAAQALNDRSFVLLIGEPASGKSLIAASLALSAIDSWGSPTMKIRNGDEFKARWNPKEKQFFWVDDSFGPTQFKADLAQGWNSVIPELRSALKKGARVLFTSRDYIWNSAQHAIKGSEFPVIFDSQVVIRVQELKLEEKRQILYNHLKLGTQPRLFRSAVKPFLEKIAENRAFLPEIARRLGDPIFTRKLSLDQDALRDFVERPLSFLKKVIQELDKPSKAAIALLFVSGGNVPSPISGSGELNLASELLGATPAEIRDSMKALSGSLVKRIRLSGSDYWTYKHPTVGDAFADIVADDPELLHIYIRGAKAERLADEVVCGDLDVEGARVVVPESLFSAVANTLQLLKRKPLLQFLSTRCDEVFLKQYLALHPDFPADLANLASYQLAFSPEIQMAARLRKMGLLNETAMRAIFRAIEDLAVDKPDTDFLNEKYVFGLLSQAEADEILRNVKDRIVPVASDFVQRRRRNYDFSEPPDDYFSPIISVLETLQDRFGEDPDVSLILDEAVSEAYGALDSAKEEYRDADSSSDGNREYYEDSEPRYSTVNEEDRSIFDDVDQ